MQSIICVSNDTYYCAFSIDCPYNYFFISTVDDLLYALLSLYPDMFTLIYYLTHIKGIN